MCTRLQIELICQVSIYHITSHNTKVIGRVKIDEVSTNKIDLICLVNEMNQIALVNISRLAQTETFGYICY